MQNKRRQQKIMAPTKTTTKPADNEDESTTINHRLRISQRVREKKPNNNRIAFLAENETADIPVLKIKRRGARELGGANMHLQLDEWDYDKYFVNEIIDEDTGKSLEYRDLVKMGNYDDTWTNSSENELGRPAQGIREVTGTNTILFIPKSDIPKYRRK